MLRKDFLVLVAVGVLLIWTMFAAYGLSHLTHHPYRTPKQTNVLFLKTHKTGSSTVQNLMFRFAERHNLTVAFPKKECGGYTFCYPRSFNTKFVHPSGTLPANILANHMRFNHAEVRRLMPNHIYITILREPASMFESMFSYFKETCEIFKKSPSLKAFMKHPQRYYQPNEPNKGVVARNCLTFDLGGDKDRPATDAAYVSDLVAAVERSFSLVMIAEHFDESLVLLRRLLSWDLDDVLYVRQNMRAAGGTARRTSLATARRTSLADAPGLAAKMRAWNSLDVQLYDHFNASLWRKLAALGPASVLAEELRLLRRAQERLMRSCFGGELQLRSAKQIQDAALRPYLPDSSVDIVGYDLPDSVKRKLPKLCLRLITPALPYLDLLRDRETSGGKT